MGRGGKLPGGVEVRGDSIRIAFQVRGVRCRETLHLPPTASNIKHAERLRAEILRKIELGTFNYAEYFPDSARAGLLGFVRAEAPTFRQLVGTFFASGELEKSTINGYRKSLARYVEPVRTVWESRIDRITYLQISEILASVEASRKTRNNLLVPIRRIFSIAFAEGYIDTNPALRLAYLRHQTPPPDPFDQAEVDAILAHMAERYGQQVENYFGLAFFAGMRPSEQIELAWSDIDFRSDTAAVSRARVLHEVKATKTARGRLHQLNSRAAAYLDAQRSHTQMKGGLVFLDPVTGRPYNDEKPPRERYWRPALRALGLRYRETYQTRATYITTAIMAGANPMWVARQVGNSPQMIFKHYARWIDSADRCREAEKLESVLGQKWGKTQGNSGAS